MKYRVVRVDIGGIGGRTTIADCDADARAQAQLVTIGRAAEVWCSDRQLTTLLPDRGAASPANRVR